MLILNRKRLSEKKDQASAASDLHSPAGELEILIILCPTIMKVEKNTTKFFDRADI